MNPNTNFYYDLIIIGGGPTGLTLAQCLRNTYKNIIIIERENTLGGCHRVQRLSFNNNENLFTEHSPRIYSNIYINFINILKDMNLDFYTLFTPYKFFSLEIGKQTILSILNYRELFELFKCFFKLLLNENYGNNISIGQFMTSKNFSKESYKIIDRLTRLTDGATASNYNLNEFLQMINQQSLYNIYQPKKPNDKGLISLWSSFLTSNGITTLLNTEVLSLNLNSTNNYITSINIKNNITNNTSILYGHKFILAISPQEFLPILQNSNTTIQNSFGDFNFISNYSSQTEYIPYVSITFHWNEKLNLPKKYGFPYSNWGLAYITLSDYMDLSDETSSQTLISVSLTVLDEKSKTTNKTAHESSQDELIQETFNQLTESFPNLKYPTYSILSPQISFNNITKQWQMKDKSFISSSFNNTFLSSQSESIPNLYNCGTHNGKSPYKFTSLESAVTNAIYLSTTLDPSLNSLYSIQSPYTIRNTLKSILSITIFIFILLLIYNLSFT